MIDAAGLVLGIETSCDDTSVAVVGTDGRVLASRVVNQDNEHRIFGGVVPELASRNHAERILLVLESALQDADCDLSAISGLAVTARPGLVGSLLVGLMTAKTLALARGWPWVGVNHLEGHLLAPFLHDADYRPPREADFPCVALIASGGHSHLFLLRGFCDYSLIGQTFDDAAGEALDKFAKVMGLGFPGGARVDELARRGDRAAFAFPRPLIAEDHLNFSFSGLKTAGLRAWENLPEPERIPRRPDLCASYQEAVVDTLLAKLDRARRHHEVRTVIITGGVSANSRLRERAEAWARDSKLTLLLPPPRYCTDNAAMIAFAGLQRLSRGLVSPEDLGPSPVSWPEDFHLEGVLA